MAAAHRANDAQAVNRPRLSPPPDGEPGQATAEQGIWACGDTPLPPQLWQSGGGAPGGGFGQDGVLDGMPPGPELGLLLPAAADMAGLGDNQLTGVARGWRRMGSWAAAMEHAAVAELVRRRVTEAETCGARGEDVPRYAAAEVAAALRLTSCSADGLMGRAVSLAGLPQTWAALCAGRIDVPKALVILNGVSCLRGELARAVEAAVVAAAAGQTTGELRKAVAAAVVAADPAAADARVAEAQKSARVERWAEPCGTAALAGRDLPPGEVLAADNRVSALAAALKADGAPGGIDQLRAEVFLGLLLGRPVAAPAPGTAPGTTVTGAPHDTAAGPGAAQGTAPGIATSPTAGTALGTAANSMSETAATRPAAAASPDVRTGSGAAGARRPCRVGDLGAAAVAGDAPTASGTRPGRVAGGVSAADGVAVPARAVRGGAVPGGAVPGGAVPGGTVPGGTVPGGAVPGGTDVSCDATVSGGTVAVGLAAGAGFAQPPSAAGAGDELGLVSGRERVPAGMPQVPAGEMEAIPAGLRRVPAGPAQAAELPVARWPGMAGSVNLTVPLRALLGQPGQPAEVAGFGPLSPAVARDLLTAAQHSPAVRWCVTVTDDQGRAAGHGCATRATRATGQPGGWGFTLTVRALESGDCAHRRESRGYEPAPMLRHLIQTRHKTCTFPGCGRPSRRCDADHTVAYDAGGRTCECNLAPLCRFHHKVKQARGWRLKQPSPGVLQWVAPSGWRYTINSSVYRT